jgi:hypothetical protein
MKMTAPTQGTPSYLGLIHIEHETTTIYKYVRQEDKFSLRKDFILEKPISLVLGHNDRLICDDQIFFGGKLI